VSGQGHDFAAWYEREVGGVCASLAVVLGDGRFAEEVAAEAFARAWADWVRVQGMASPVGWVYRVALNQARGRFRRRRIERRFALGPSETVAAPKEPDDELWQAVRMLPPRARTAIALRYVADLPEAEVAELMRVARGTVAATLFSARRKLAEMLGDSDREVLQ
jgi:RNA polymerase sigma factor (sigma-70 family)